MNAAAPLSRRPFLLAPLAAALTAALPGCAERGSWPEGMLAIHWDRDRCSRCGMALSDRRYAVELRGGPKNEAFKFDDIGCAVTWCAEKHQLYPWAGEAVTRWWVADFEASPPGSRWLDARAAHYTAGPRSPMGYDLAAHAAPREGSRGFDAMAARAAATWPADCAPTRAAGTTPSRS